MFRELMHWPATASVPAKLGLSALVIVIAWLLTSVARILGEHRSEVRHVRARFWAHQFLRVTVTLLWISSLIWIWIGDSSRLATIFAVVTAGLTVALQRVVTSIAGYFSILRGNTFTVGDRITMGGVRGDVVALSYLRTTVMEMGQPPSVQGAEPAMWVAGRQYTGRIVTISNDKIFDTPVYNYTREFPFIWDEIRIPIKFEDDWHRVETMLSEIATRATNDIIAEAREALPHLLDRFTLFEKPAVEPATFVRITDNWVELTVRFLARDHGVRVLKSAMSREILHALRDANIGIASTTLAVVSVPAVEVVTSDPPR